jgi:hypothetical protein
MKEEGAVLVGAEENTGVGSKLLNDPVGASARANDSGSKKDIPEMIDLRDIDGASSLVVELFPAETMNTAETSRYRCLFSSPNTSR